jgi:hypothetical protein
VAKLWRQSSCRVLNLKAELGTWAASKLPGSVRRFLTGIISFGPEPLRDLVPLFTGRRDQRLRGAQVPEQALLPAEEDRAAAPEHQGPRSEDGFLSM